MSSFRDALIKLFELEFGNNPRFALHRNPTEQALTYKGIYQKVFQEWRGWEIIARQLNASHDSLTEASEALEQSGELQGLVSDFYRDNCWNKARLDEVKSQKITEEIFVFGVNVGMVKAIKTAQEILGLSADGVVGPITLAALNRANEGDFSLSFDKSEMGYYQSLIKRKPYMAIYARGWERRAYYV